MFRFAILNELLSEEDSQRGMCRLMSVTLNFSQVHVGFFTIQDDKTKVF